MTEKAAMRKEMRKLRREHAAAIPDNVRGLLFRHPPAPLMNLIPDGAVIGLYHATPEEAPASGYAKHFSEAGHPIALPRFDAATSPMAFAKHTDPFGETDLEDGEFGLKQPKADAERLVPDIVFTPLIAFTEAGARLGQGGGHYDRWLSDNPQALAVGMAWDCQLVEQLAIEDHDIPLAAVVTPTRLFGPFDA